MEEPWKRRIADERTAQLRAELAAQYPELAAVSGSVDLSGPAPF
ncbi:hypothetical protein ACWCXX_37625 [Streptomyces sp. NPDC001732]